MSTYCPQCGNLVVEGAAHCTQCGTPLGPVDAPTTVQSTLPPGYAVPPPGPPGGPPPAGYVPGAAPGGEPP